MRFAKASSMNQVITVDPGRQRRPWAVSGPQAPGPVLRRKNCNGVSVAKKSVDRERHGNEMEGKEKRRE